MAIATDDQTDGRNGYSVSTLIRRGWTKTMIVKMLGDADELADNPHYSNGHAMQLYSFDRVHTAEATEAFRLLQSVLRQKDRQPVAPRVRKPSLYEGRFSVGS